MGPPIKSAGYSMTGMRFLKLRDPSGSSLRQGSTIYTAIFTQ